MNTNGTSSMTTSERVSVANSIPGTLKHLDCPLCKNKGVVYYEDADGAFLSKPCKCMPERKSRYRINKSGLSETLERYTLEAYKADTAETRAIKAATMKYITERKGWFFISGKAGSGKTHICTAICGVLLQKGHELRYMLWRDVAPRLKATINDREAYEKLMDELKSVEVLYIDDFFKGSVNDADINLAFELINSRYNNTKKLTLISTEKSIDEILGIDEAIGSRIYERSKGYCLKAPQVNRRLKE